MTSQNVIHSETDQLSKPKHNINVQDKILLLAYVEENTYMQNENMYNEILFINKTEENLSKITDESFKLFCTSKHC